VSCRGECGEGLRNTGDLRSNALHVVEYCGVLQCVAVCCSVLQCVAVCCIALRLWQCVAVCYSGECGKGLHNTGDLRSDALRVVD